MMSFSCEGCGDVLVGDILGSHVEQCRGASFACSNCEAHFQGTDYHSHTSCISKQQEHHRASIRRKKEEMSETQNCNVFEAQAPQNAYENDCDVGKPDSSSRPIHSQKGNVFPLMRFLSGGLFNDSGIYLHSPPRDLESCRIPASPPADSTLRGEFQSSMYGAVGPERSAECHKPSLSGSKRPLNEEINPNRSKSPRLQTDIPAFGLIPSTFTLNTVSGPQDIRRTMSGSEMLPSQIAESMEDRYRYRRAEGGQPASVFAQPSVQLAIYNDVDMERDHDQLQDDTSEIDMREDSTNELVPITPTVAGFRDHVLRLNPTMNASYLVDRIAYWQVVRYKALLSSRVKHCGSVKDKNCSAGSHCIVQGGSATHFDRATWRINGKVAPGLSEYEDYDSDTEIALGSECFPPGIPLPPAPSLPAEFECQLCFKVKKFRKPSDWTKHVHEDVQPFTCTFSNCKEPKSFKRKADWVRHENERHRHLEWWACEIDDCTHKCYRKDNFLQHLVREHKLPEPKGMTKSAVKKDQGSDEAVWVMIKNCHHETISKPQDEPCKFCGKCLTSWKKLTVHLAKHMEHISMPVLRHVEQQQVTADTIVSPVEPPPNIWSGGTTFGRDMFAYSSPYGSMTTSSSPNISTEGPSPRMSPYYATHSMILDSSNMALYSPFTSPYLPALPETSNNDKLTLDAAFRTFNSPLYPLAPPAGFISSPPNHSTNPYSSRLSNYGNDLTRITEQPWDIKSFASLDDSGKGSLMARSISKENWDIESVASIDDSGIGTMPTSTESASTIQTHIPRTAQQELLLILNSDLVLRALFSEGAKRINKGRFIRNVRRLLLLFYKDLQNTAADPRERDATSMLGRHAEWFASRLFDISNPDNIVSARNMEVYLNQHIDKRPILEKYLGSAVTRSKPLRTAQDAEAEDYEDGDEEHSSSESGSHESGSISTFDETSQHGGDIDYSNFPNLEHIKNFIVGGAPFTNLRRHTFQFVHPEIPSQSHRSHIKVSLASAGTTPASKKSKASSKLRIVNIVDRISFADLVWNLVLAQRVIRRLKTSTHAMTRAPDQTAIESRTPNMEGTIDSIDGIANSSTGSLSGPKMHSVSTRPLAPQLECQNLIDPLVYTTRVSGDEKDDSMKRIGWVRKASSSELSTSLSPHAQQLEDLTKPSSLLEHHQSSWLTTSEPRGHQTLPQEKAITPPSLEQKKVESLPSVERGRSTNEGPSPGSSEYPASQSSCHASISTDTTDPAISEAEGHYSDEDSEILSDDPELYNGKPEPRILNPKTYFDGLAALEREVYEDSCVMAYKSGKSSGPAQDAVLLLPPKASDMSMSHEFIIEMVKNTMSEELLQLLECRNLIVRVSRNLKRLQDYGYCDQTFSMLVVYSSRRGVARLLQIEIKRVLDLRAAFESMLNSVALKIHQLSAANFDEDTIKSIIQSEDPPEGVTTKCFAMLVAMGLRPLLLLSNKSSELWACAVQILELALLSYAGAHIQRFDLKFLETEVGHFQIPRKFIYHDPGLRSIPPLDCDKGIQLRLRQLQCLDKFLGNKPVWAFHQDYDDAQDERLCLSTTIEALTDLWGPSWKTVSNSEPEHIQKYDIGNGSIVPWSPTVVNGCQRPAVRHSEIFCHWISHKSWNDLEVDLHQVELSRRHFLDSDTLLIGASTDHGLLVNQECTLTLERLSRIKTKLSEDEALRPLKVCRAKRYIDSHEVQVQASAMGFVNAAGTVVYKRQKGQTMKDALVERWRHNLRNPMDLEAFSGVEVSLCTKNARRRRLLHILKSQTMCNYLQGISFSWESEECGNAYFRALRCPKAFRKFWKSHPEWQENVGDAVSKCMDALEETGINEDNRELSALLIESFDTEGDSDGESDGESDSGTSVRSLAKPSNAVSKYLPVEEWIVTLFRSEHTWTGFLEDSEETLTMAIVGTACLDFEDDEGVGRRCSKPRRQWEASSWYKGFPVLQTSLQLNESILKKEYLTHRKIDRGKRIKWNADELKTDTKFSLGSHGTLRVISSSTRCCPVIMEWNPMRCELLEEVKDVGVNQRLLGKNVARHHREYIRGKWEADPLPILVLSKSTKPAFSAC